MVRWMLLFCLSLTPLIGEAARPNVLVILVDDLGYGDLTCYGAPDLKSPHVDQLAAEGQRWTRFYANCPVCSPTRAALMTGRYQDLVGVPGVIRTHSENNWGDLADDAVLLPAALKSAGYHSACIGKWHLGLDAPDRPRDRGFGLFHGFLGDMMDDYYIHERHNINYMRLGDTVIDPEGHATDLFTDWAIDYIKARGQVAKQKPDSPWFCYLAYNAPHTPIQPPDEWVAKVKEREQGISDQRAKLVALIEHLDDGIGRVLEALGETGQRENTVVLFSSDNGGQISVGANNGATRDGKGTVYEGGIRVAAIARWPGVVAAGSETDQMAMTMDLYPTVLEIAGAEVPGPIDGVSVLPTLRGETQETLRTASFFRRREGGNYNGQTIDAVISGKWKLLQNMPWEPMELYNLEVDPLEENNLAAKAPRVRQELAKALMRHRQRCGAVSWQAPAMRDEAIKITLP